MTQEKRFIISEGPSKFDLMTALFKGDVVRFTIKSRESKTFTTELLCKINSISCEDGSRESWIISGYVPGPKDGFLQNKLAWKEFGGYFETRKRCGWIEER